MASLSTRPRPFGVLYRLYQRILSVLAVLLVGGTVVIMGTQVFFRYVLNDSLIWAEEVCGYLLVWTTFLFLGRAFQNGELVVVNAVLDRIGRRAGFVCLLVGYGLVIAFLGMLVVYGYEFAEFNTITTVPAADFIWTGLTGSDTPLDMSAFWIYLALPIGCGILLVHILFWLCGRIMDYLRPAGPGDPADPAGPTDAAGSRRGI